MNNDNKKMNFNIVQSHNRHDCKIENGRYGRRIIYRSVAVRIGYIITAFGRSPRGFCSISDLVAVMNKMFKGAMYHYNDIYPTLKRMSDEAGIVERNETTGLWTLSKKAQSTWNKVEKNLRCRA